MSTMHQRYQANPLGFDSFDAWMRHHEKLHAQCPLGCDAFGKEWLDLWRGLDDLLKMPARIEYLSARYRAWTPIFGVVEHVTVAQCLKKAMISPLLRGEMFRVVFLSGTIIKEWGPR